MEPKAAKVRMKTSTTGSSRAFTLVELLVVLAIMGTVGMTIAIGLGRSLSLTRLRSDVQALAGTARLARSTAVSECRRVRIEYNLDDNAYRLVIERDPVAEPGVFADFGRADGAPRALDRDVSFISVQTESTLPRTEGMLFTTFFRDGTAEKTVMYLGAEDDVYTLVIRGSTGLVRVFDFEKEEIARDDLDLDEDRT